MDTKPCANPSAVDLLDLRAARNSYNSAVKAAEGFTSGVRVFTRTHERKRLEALLWKHRDFLINAVTTPI